VTGEYDSIAEEDIARYVKMRLSLATEKGARAWHDMAQVLASTGMTQLMLDGGAELDYLAQELAVNAKALCRVRRDCQWWTKAAHTEGESPREALAAVRSQALARAMGSVYRYRGEARDFYTLSAAEYIQWWLDECDSQPDGMQRITDEEGD
jgi:hypothetical protein